MLCLLPHTSCTHVRTFEIASVPLVNPLLTLAHVTLDAALGNRKFCMLFLAYTVTHILYSCSTTVLTFLKLTGYMMHQQA
jgi:hypothetical protein